MIAVALIVPEMLVEHQLRWVVPETPMGVVYVATVHVVSNVWRSASRVGGPGVRRRLWLLLHPAFLGFRFLRSAGQTIERRVRERVVVSVEVLFRVARPRGDGERR